MPDRDPLRKTEGAVGPLLLGPVSSYDQEALITSPGIDATAQIEGSEAGGAQGRKK